MCLFVPRQRRGWVKMIVAQAPGSSGWNPAGSGTSAQQWATVKGPSDVWEPYRLVSAQNNQNIHVLNFHQLKQNKNHVTSAMSANVKPAAQTPGSHISQWHFMWRTWLTEEQLNMHVFVLRADEALHHPVTGSWRTLLNQASHWAAAPMNQRSLTFSRWARLARD